jgi:hypothetical protein
MIVIFMNNGIMAPRPSGRARGRVPAVTPDRQARSSPAGRGIHELGRAPGRGVEYSTISGAVDPEHEAPVPAVAGMDVRDAVVDEKPGDYVLDPVGTDETSVGDFVVGGIGT